MKNKRLFKAPKTKQDSKEIPLIAGFISGLSTAVFLKTNISLDQEHYLRMVLSSVCDITNSTFPKATAFAKPDCGLYLLLFDIFTAIVFIVTFFAAIFSTGNIREGILLYIIGFVVGFALIYLGLH